MILEPEKKYSREEVQIILEFTPEQVKIAEKNKLIFFGGPKENYMYGIYLFQFLRNHGTTLEQIKEGNYGQEARHS